MRHQKQTPPVWQQQPETLNDVQVEEMRRLAEEAELARVAEQEAREEAERQRKMQEAAAKQKAREEEIERRVRVGGSMRRNSSATTHPTDACAYSDSCLATCWGLTLLLCTRNGA